MIAVIFELLPSREDRCRDLTAMLKAKLRLIPGHISAERFESAATPAKYLLLSFFTDEDAVAQWRDLWGHRAAEAEASVLGEYRLRMGYVSQDYGSALPTGASAEDGKDRE